MSLPTLEAPLPVESRAAQEPPERGHPRVDLPAVLADEDDIRSVVSRALEEGREAARSAGETAATAVPTPSVEEAARETGPEPVQEPVIRRAVPFEGGPVHPAPVAPHHRVARTAPAGAAAGANQAAPPRTAEEREKATLRNINITLYAASLLLIAAASLFIGLAMPPLAKFGGLVAVTTLFYAGGLLIHSFSKRLRPAGVAFAGTGLALIPVSGLALSALVVHNPATAWWITSLVGTVAFVYAAARLNSRVVAYLSLTFLVSSAWAGGAVLNRGLFWYFMFSMVLAAAGTALAYSRPGWLGNIYLRAFKETHRFLAPATLVIAVLAGQMLGAEDLSLLLIAGTIYYAAVTIFGPTPERAVNLVAARLCATGAIVLLTYVFGLGPVGVARSLGIVLLLQALAVHRAGDRYRRFIAPKARGLVGFEVQALLVAVAGLALLLNESLVASFRVLGESLETGSTTGWASVNYLLPLVALTAVALSTRSRILPPWIALGIGVAGLLEPGAVLSPWRQVAFLVVGLACAIPGLRRAVGRQALWLRRGVVVLLPTTLATIAAWALGGFLVTTSVAGPGVGAWFFGSPGRLVSGGADPRVLMLITGLVFVISWMAVAALAAWKLESGFMLASVAVVVAAEVRLSTLESGGDPWTTTVAMTTLVLAAVGSNALLGTLSRGRGRTARRKTLIAHGVAPLAIVATWLASFGIENRWLVLAVCLTGLGHAAWRLVSAREPVERAAYAVAAQLFFSLSILELTHQLHADVHARWALFAISLAVGQSARLWLRRRGDGSPPTAYGPMIANATLALLFLAPLVYFGIHGGSEPGAGVDMAALLVQYLCLLIVGLLGWRADLAAMSTASGQGTTAISRQILVVAYALAWLVYIPSGLISLREGGWLQQPWWNSTALLVLLLVMAVLALVVEAREPVERGVYAVVAQLFFSLSLLELSYQLRADAHTLWALFAISLAVGQAARLWLRPRVDAPPATYGPMIANATLALLFLTPLVYFGIHGGSEPGAGVDMASLLVQYLCLLFMGLLKWRLDLAAAATASSMWRAVARMQILVVGYALAWLMVIPSGLIPLRQGGWLPEPLWNPTVLLILLLVIALLVTSFEALAPDTAVRRRVAGLLAGEEGAGLLGRSGSGLADSAHLIARAIAAAGYLGFAATVVLADASTSAGSHPAPIPGGGTWLAVILLAAAAGCVVFAVTTGLPLVLIGAIIFLPWAILVALAQWTGDTGSMLAVSRLYMASAVCSATLLYAAGWLHRPRTRADSGFITAPRSWSWLHARILTGGAIVLLFVDGFEANVMRSQWGSAGPATILAYIGTAMIAVAAVAAVAEFPRKHRERCGEVAALVVAGCVQHAWHLAYGQPGLFWMTQYWVVVLALLAAYEIRAGRRKDADYPLIASAFLLSTSALFGLAVEQGWGQGWLLLAHVLLLAAGLLLNRRLYVVWGAIAAALIVLWFLRGFTILLLAALAAGLIALAIWRLQRLGKDKEVPQALTPEPERPDSAPPASAPGNRTDMSATEQQER